MNSDMNVLDQHANVNRAFSKQSFHYDANDVANPILSDMRFQVYRHVEKYLLKGSHILELNAGTGIDALYFATKGYFVHATDLSQGMIARIKEKIIDNRMTGNISYQQLSYDALDRLPPTKFDYVFSNFGGLNCIRDLGQVTSQLSSRLNDGAYITWVVMPPVSLWELSWLIKGNIRSAFRRLHRNGVMAHVESEYFKTYYHGLRTIRKAFGDQFELVQSEALCAVSPPPAAGNFLRKNPKTYALLRRLDRHLRNIFPFNRWGDHIIVTFRKK